MKFIYLFINSNLEYCSFIINYYSYIEYYTLTIQCCAIGLMSNVFVNGPRDRGSISYQRFKKYLTLCIIS